MGMSISIYYRVAQCLIYFSIYFRTTGSSHGLTAALLVAILFGCILLKRVDRKNFNKKVAYRLYLRLCPTRWMGEMKCEYTAVGRCPQVQRELVSLRSACVYYTTRERATSTCAVGGRERYHHLNEKRTIDCLLGSYVCLIERYGGGALGKLSPSRVLWLYMSMRREITANGIFIKFILNNRLNPRDPGIRAGSRHVSRHLRLIATSPPTPHPSRCKPQQVEYDSERLVISS